jgi:16S rRNA (cytosine967-C5)-methyltransferase
VNALRSDVPAVVAEFEREGIMARRDDDVPEALVLEHPYDLHASSLFERGAIMPQSRGSMLVARTLDAQPGERVLDLCAAPGAKTTHIAAQMGDEGEVVAVELDERRAHDIEANAQRLGASSVRVVVGDAAAGDFGSRFDRVLVDPPCSDLGTLQSRPDARWRKSPAQVSELSALQSRILDSAVQALRPGGRLVYSTCTISPRENELQMEALVERHPDLRGGDRGFVQTLPHRDHTDGFFIASFDRHE